jgi:hypothetical protein
MTSNLAKHRQAQCKDSRSAHMGIFGIAGLKSSVGAALAVTLTSLLAWAFASSAASIERLGEAAETTIVASLSLPGSGTNG